MLDTASDSGVPEDAWPASGNRPDDRLARVAAVVHAFARGEIVVVSDDDDREDEGDLFVAAEHCTPERMAFIIRHTSGIVCAPLSGEVARRLRLDPMVAVNDAPLATAFTVSVDARRGLRTGISAEERCATVRALARLDATADDFVRPGHVFPLVAREGGVLIRSGHTEACVDLCRLAGLRPVGVLAELVNDDGTVKRGPEVGRFAEEHRLPRVSVADLIAHRQARERLVERVASFPVATAVGELAGHAYVTPFDEVHHLALVHGRIGGGRDVPVRLHRSDVLADVFGGAGAIGAALRRFAAEGCGVLVYLRDGTAGVPTTRLGGPEGTGSARDRHRAWREIGIGAQILRDLDCVSIRLLSSSRLAYVGLTGFGISIAGVDPLDSRPSEPGEGRPSGRGGVRP